MTPDPPVTRILFLFCFFRPRPRPAIRNGLCHAGALFGASARMLEPSSSYGDHRTRYRQPTCEPSSVDLPVCIDRSHLGLLM